MLTEPAANREGRTRAILRYTWIVIAVVALLIGWVIFSRWQENRQIEQRAAEKKRAGDRGSVEMLGGSRFEILHFYASPAVIRRGDTAQICYGVSNAKTVRLDPPAGSVWPSLSRCVEVAPKKNTTYTLTAEDAAGQARTATVTVQVVR